MCNAGRPFEVCRHLGQPDVDSTMRALFRHVSNHVRQVQEEIKSLREVLALVVGVCSALCRRFQRSGWLSELGTRALGTEAAPQRLTARFLTGKDRRVAAAYPHEDRSYVRRGIGRHWKEG
jgi:hypothetical protein